MENIKEGGSDRRNWAAMQSLQKLQLIPEPNDCVESSLTDAKCSYLSHHSTWTFLRRQGDWMTRLSSAKGNPQKGFSFELALPTPSAAVGKVG